MLPQEAALSYLARGWAPIPLLPGDKKAAVPWREFQNHTPSKNLIRSWWNENPNFNIGLILGAGSRNLVAIVADPKNRGPPTFTTFTGGRN
jgi:hypothetical protein